MKKLTTLNKQGCVLIALLASTSINVQALDLSTPEGFEAARRPMTNAVFFDLAIPRTGIHPFFIHHEFPDQVAVDFAGVGGTPGVTTVPMGGDAQIYAAQIEIAFNKNISFVAAKDGYISFNPEQTFKETEGFADLAMGIKHAVIRDDEKEFALGYKVIVELPTGDDDVWQGNGSGNITPALTFLKLWNSNIQAAGNIGIVIPFDDTEESTLFMQSYHFSFGIAERIFPLVELNHYHVVDSASGTPGQNNHFNSQVGGAVPFVATFEGGDLINLGSTQSDGSDIVTMAIGARGRVNDNIDLGAAYEFTLSDEEESLYAGRLTIDIDFTF